MSGQPPGTQGETQGDASSTPADEGGQKETNEGGALPLLSQRT